MINVTILYPADPMGVVAGGIDTFIRGILRWAPEDLNISLIGVTTNRAERPIGQWTECDLGRRKYRFFAVASLDNPGGRGRIPLVVRYMIGLLRFRPKFDADILEFHRIEPSLLYYFDRRPKNAFFHQNMQILHNNQSDILWSKAPKLYLWIQDRLIRRIDSIYAVRTDAVEFYKKRYSNIANRFNFVPTWFDPDIFNSVDSQFKLKLRDQLGIDITDELIVTVGRLDKQKNPILLAKAFTRVLLKRPKVKLWYIGDGILRADLESFLLQQGIDSRVTLKGLIPATEIARILQAANLFVLSSAYEGMPICALEALGSGLPVVTTDVGEVGLAVINGVSGEVTKDQHEKTLSEAILKVLANPTDYSNDSVTKSVSPFIPSKVLAPIYDKYRQLAPLSIGHKQDK
jgi:glycosyltransferase involved in cell wall biosynthesis